MRMPFKPPYTREDLPQLDILHEEIGLYEKWMRSERRHEIEMTPAPGEEEDDVQR